MNRRKTTVSVLIFLSVVLFCFFASAENGAAGGATLPAGSLAFREIPQTAAYEPVELPTVTEPVPGNDSGLSKGTAVSFSVSQSGNYFTRHTWTVTSVSGASGPFLFTYDLVVPHYENGQTQYESVVHVEKNKANSFYYRFEWNGAYELWITVHDQYGRNLAFRQFQFTLNDANHYERLTVKLYTQQDGGFSGPTVWTTAANGGSGGYTYLFQLTESETGFEHSMVSRSRDYQPDYGFAYQFIASGEYELMVIVRDSVGNEAADVLTFSKYDSNAPTLTYMANSLIKQCKAQGNTTDYEIARWAHDWLVSHVNYDHTFVHYGADSALLPDRGGSTHGTTVCDGYAKAFYMLMKAAGIPCERVTSDDAGHAWNEVKLGGKWYQVDCTWDDGSAGSGYDSHRYCFITDEAMRKDHAYSAPHACTSVVCNYFVQERVADTWLKIVLDSVGDKLQDGVFSYPVSLPATYAAEGYDYLPESAIGVMADTFCCIYVSYYHDFYFRTTPVKMNLTGYRQQRRIGAEVDLTGKTVTLPASLKVIESAAFASDTSMMAVIIPKGATAIGERAFRGCGNLWKVVIPASVTSIPNSAFDFGTTGSGHLCIVAPRGSAGYNYAMNNGLIWMDLGN